MSYHIIRQEAFSLGSIETENVGVTVVHLSVDTHQSNTSIDQGIHHVYPDALVSGAGKYRREEFLGALSLLGANIDTAISGGILTITVRSTSASFLKVLTLLETMLTTPTFAESELKRIRTTVTNALHTKREQSPLVAHEELRNTLYGKSDRRYTTSYQTITKELSHVTTEILHTKHDSVMNSFWTCTIAGDKKNINDFCQLIRSIKQERKLLVSKIKHEQRPSTSGLILKDIPSRTNIDFSIGTPIPITLHHPDFTPLVFALGVLALPGFAGRLMSTVRNKEGLTYMIYGHKESFSGSEHGYVRIATFFSPDKTLTGLTATFRELKKFYRSGITQAEFDTFQTIFTTKQTMLQDSLLRQVADLHSFNKDGFSVEEILAYKAQLKHITRQEVNTVIKKYFDPKKFVISGAGPISSVKKEIQAFMTTVS